MSEIPRLTVVIPVLKRVDDLDELYAGYRDALAQLDMSHEVLFVIDGGNDQAYEVLTDVQARGGDFTIVRLAKSFGESTVLTAAFEQARGELILTLPAYYQIQPDSISRLFDRLDEADVLIARRWPRAGGRFENFRRGVFHFLLRTLSGEQYNDLGCNVRLFRRGIVEEIHLYGDLHRFFPVLASRQGFRVMEVDVEQSPKDEFRGRYRLREYLHRLLDMVTVFFLVRFTKKPLRFFGMVGSVVFAFGAFVVLTLVVQRLFFEIALADRPALLLGSLALVLGMQIFALGLIGELIIFTHAGQMKEYTIAEIVSSKGREDVRLEYRRAGTS